MIRDPLVEHLLGNGESAADYGGMVDALLALLFIAEPTPQEVRRVIELHLLPGLEAGS